MRTNILIIIIISSIAILAAVIFIQNRIKTTDLSIDIVSKTWQSYKKFFISNEGRVKRNKDGDTVSEGQAYAMLRAVWMNDKKTFDLCYEWTENNLSRKTKFSDHLLAWKWKNESVQDWMPASDADIDYALSLIFADRLWGKTDQTANTKYAAKAKQILNDILEKMTYQTNTGRLYLSPWILSAEERTAKNFPVNPSYYSPAHFRIFHQFTNDKRWKNLQDTTYFILESLSESFEGQKGIGLIPDWCKVDQQDSLSSMEGKSNISGWESVRIPIRVYMDYLWFDNPDAGKFLNKLAPFLKQEWNNLNTIFSEYTYTGQAVKKYENPLFYTAYFCILVNNSPDISSAILKKIRGFLREYDKSYVYLDTDDYYTNSLAWFSDGFACDIVQEIKIKE